MCFLAKQLLCLPLALYSPTHPAYFLHEQSKRENSPKGWCSDNRGSTVEYQDPSIQIAVDTLQGDPIDPYGPGDPIDPYGLGDPIDPYGPGDPYGLGDPYGPGDPMDQLGAFYSVHYLCVLVCRYTYAPQSFLPALSQLRKYFGTKTKTTEVGCHVYRNLLCGSKIRTSKLRK